MGLAIEMYEQFGDNPTDKRAPYSLQNGSFQLNDDSFGRYGRDDAYKSYFEKAKKVYPQLTVQEWNKYLNSALGTISEFKGKNGYAINAENGTVSLLTNDKQLAIGQKRNDWGQLFLELWAEHENKSFKVTKYTVETISLSEQTNKNFLNTVAGKKNASYSGSMAASRRVVKRLYGKDVVIVDTPEKASQKDKGTTWYETEKDKINAINSRISELLKNSDNNSVVIRVDSEEQAEQLRAMLGDNARVYSAQDSRWNTDRDAYIDDLKNFVQTKGRVAIVTSSFTTGLDLRTRGEIEQLDLIDSETGSYITEQQLQAS